MRHSAFIYETDLHLLLIYQCHVGVRRARSEGGTLLAHGLFNPTLWPQDIPTSSLSELVSDVDVVPRLADTEEGDSEYEDDSESEAEIVGEPEDEMSESEGE